MATEIHQIVVKISRSLKKDIRALGHMCCVNCKDGKYEEIILQKYFAVKTTTTTKENKYKMYM